MEWAKILPLCSLLSVDNGVNSMFFIESWLLTCIVSGTE